MPSELSRSPERAITRAMVLAAGVGSRLGPLTSRCPKPMLDVCGRPVLEWVVRQLALAGIAEAVINLHHSPEVIVNHFGDGSAYDVRIHYSYEETLLGTAGAIKAAEHHFLDEPFFLVYGDNLTTCDFGALTRLHNRSDAAATIALFQKTNLRPHSMVVWDADHRIREFVEKPDVPEHVSGWISAGLAILEHRVLSFVPPGIATDFGRDVVPALIRSGERVVGYPMTPDEGLWWIDTHEAYASTTKAWSAVVSKMHGVPSAD